MKVPSINIKVRNLKSGKRSYFIEYRVDGVRKLEKAGDTKAEAELFKAQRITEFKNQKYQLNTVSISLANLLSNHLHSKRHYITPKSYGRYKVLFDAFQLFIDSYFPECSKDSSKIKSIHIPKFIDWCLSDMSWKPATINMAKSHLRSAFNTGIKEGVITVNPFNDVKKLPTVQTSDVKFYSKEELQLIFNEMKGVWKEFFQVLYLTGMRKDELINLKWSSVNFELNQLTVKSDESFTTKTKTTRVIPIHLEVVRILKSRIGKHPVYCFTSDKANNKIGVNKPYLELVRVLKRLDIKGDVHQFRHTFASHLVMSGVSLMTVSELLGHSDIKTTMIYAHLSPDFKAKAISNLTLRF